MSQYDVIEDRVTPVAPIVNFWFSVKHPPSGGNQTIKLDRSILNSLLGATHAEERLAPVGSVLSLFHGRETRPERDAPDHGSETRQTSA
jgi:hypothetical protein